MALRHFLMLIFHRAVVLFILIIFMYTVIIVKHIFSSVISDHTEMFRIYFLHTFRRLSHGDTFPFPDKKWNLVKRDIYIVDALAEEFFADTSVREEFDEFHFFRKIHVSAFSVCSYTGAIMISFPSMSWSSMRTAILSSG